MAAEEMIIIFAVVEAKEIIKFGTIRDDYTLIIFLFAEDFASDFNTVSSHSIRCTDTVAYWTFDSIAFRSVSL